MKFFKGIFVFGVIFMFFGASVLAHGTAVSIPKEVGDYVLEFEYSTPEIIEGETNSYVFRLLDIKSKEPVVFDSVLIRFERKSDQATIAIARVTQDELQNGIGRFTVMLNKGDYIVTSSYYDSDEKMVETSYDLMVKADTSNRKFPLVPVLSVLAGVVVGLLIGFKIKSSSS